MAVIVIETATPHASIVKIGEDGGVEARSFMSDRNHNALLFSPLAELLADRPGRALSLVLVGTGPGSYSGNRVGIAAAQGIAMVGGCPAIGVPSILAVPSAVGGHACVVIGDARRGAYWFARCEAGCLTQEPRVVDAMELAQRLQDAIAQGEPIVSFEDPKRYPIEEALQGQIRQEYPTAERLWQAWQMAPEAEKARWAAQIPQPIYIKPPHITVGKDPCRVKTVRPTP